MMMCIRALERQDGKQKVGEEIIKAKAEMNEMKNKNNNNSKTQ